MVERRPLVVMQGDVQELPLGDTVAGAGTGGAAFLPTPDEVDDTDETYFYWGWAEVNGDWLVRRTLRSDASQQNATGANNSSYVDLAAAWPDRASLTYS